MPIPIEVAEKVWDAADSAAMNWFRSARDPAGATSRCAHATSINVAAARAAVEAGRRGDRRVWPDLMATQTGLPSQSAALSQHALPITAAVQRKQTEGWHADLNCGRGIPRCLSARRGFLQQARVSRPPTASNTLSPARC